LIVGRAAAAVLAGRPEVLHVRFDGEPGRRAIQAASALNLSLEEAKRRLAETDRARAEYWKVFYRREWTDATLYHLTADSTRISLDGCIELVLLAAADVLHVSARA
jgi:cytidylate kinase